MSYFGLMALFPALLLMLAISNQITAANELLTRAVDVYPGSAKFLARHDPFAVFGRRRRSHHLCRGGSVGGLLGLRCN